MESKKRWPKKGRDQFWVSILKRCPSCPGLNSDVTVIAYFDDISVVCNRVLQ